MNKNTMINDRQLLPNLKESKDIEAVNMIANFVISNITDEDLSKTIVFTSDIEREYASITLLNTAINLSKIGKKSLIIDLDFTNQYLSRKLVPSINEDLAIQTTEYPNISQLIYNSKDDFTSSMFNFEYITNYFKNLNNQFDAILINLPSILTNSVYLSLPLFIDKYIIIAKRYKSKFTKINAIVDRLKSDGKNVLGAVFINKIR